VLGNSLEQRKRPNLMPMPGGSANIPGLPSPGSGSGRRDLNQTSQTVAPQTHRPHTESSSFLPVRSRGARTRQGNPAGGGSSGVQARMPQRDPADAATAAYLRVIAEKMKR